MTLSLVKLVLKKPGFLSKSSKFYKFWTMCFCLNFTSMWSINVSNNVRRNFRLPKSAVATVARKIFYDKFKQKSVFRSGISFYHYRCWQWKSKVSPYIIDKYWIIICRYYLNKIVASEALKMSFWQKMVNRFWESVDAILEDVSVSETIVRC